MNKLILYIILGCSLIFNFYFIHKNNDLRTNIKFLEQENEKIIRETPEQYYQNAIEEFNNKNYMEAKEILNKLIKNFPTSTLVKDSKDKIKEINLVM